MTSTDGFFRKQIHFGRNTTENSGNPANSCHIRRIQPYRGEYGQVDGLVVNFPPQTTGMFYLDELMLKTPPPSISQKLPSISMFLKPPIGCTFCSHADGTFDDNVGLTLRNQPLRNSIGPQLGSKEFGGIMIFQSGPSATTNSSGHASRQRS